MSEYGSPQSEQLFDYVQGKDGESFLTLFCRRLRAELHDQSADAPLMDNGCWCLAQGTRTARWI